MCRRIVIYSCFTTVFFYFISLFVFTPPHTAQIIIIIIIIIIMSALTTQTTCPTDSVAQAIASWIQSITDVDTKVAKARARRQAAEADTSEASDAIEEECHAELCRLKKERREIGVQVTRAMHDLSALAENSGFVVVSSLSSAASSPPTSRGETKSTDRVAVAAAAEVATALTAKEKIATKLGVAVAEIVSLSLLNINRNILVVLYVVLSYYTTDNYLVLADSCSVSTYFVLYIYILFAFLIFSIKYKIFFSLFFIVTYFV